MKTKENCGREKQKERKRNKRKVIITVQPIHYSTAIIDLIFSEIDSG